MDTLLIIRNLSYQKKGKYPFQNLNLSLQSGEIAAVYGGINSGKTALVDMIAGFVKPESGQVACVPDVAVVTQQFIMYPDLTVRENLEFSAEINNFPHDKLSGIIQETNLAGWEKTRTGRIPSPLKPMLQLASAMTRDFRLLVLDDVTNGLDTPVKQVFWKLMGRMRDSGKGILLATGLWGDANRCDYIINLQSGEILDKESSSAGKNVRRTAYPAVENPVVTVENLPGGNSYRDQDASREVVS